MTTQQAISAIADFLRSEVAPGLELQQAYAQDFLAHQDTLRARVNPVVYEGAMPKDTAEATEDNPNPTHLIAPCIIVQPSGTASINLREGQVEQPISLFCQVWDPGRYEDGKFLASDAGYRDLATLVDRVVNALAQAVIPGGIRVTGEVSYTFSDFNSPDNWPYYPAEVTFTAQYHRFLPNQLTPQL